jgi:hypothetical protein
MEKIRKLLEEVREKIANRLGYDINSKSCVDKENCPVCLITQALAELPDELTLKKYNDRIMEIEQEAISETERATLHFTRAETLQQQIDKAVGIAENAISECVLPHRLKEKFIEPFEQIIQTLQGECKTCGGSGFIKGQFLYQRIGNCQANAQQEKKPCPDCSKGDKE